VSARARFAAVVVSAASLTAPAGAAAATVTVTFDPPSMSVNQVVSSAPGVTFPEAPTTFAPAEMGIHGTSSPPNALRRSEECDPECENGAYRLTMVFAEDVSLVSLRSGAEAPNPRWGCFPEGRTCPAFARLVGYDGAGRPVADSGDVKVYEFAEPIGTELAISSPEAQIRSATLFVGRDTVKSDSGDPRRALMDDLSFTMPRGPTVTVAVPPDGAAYRLGEEVRADFRCEDDPRGSGIAGCSGPVPAGELLDTSTAGQHVFSVSSADRVGNAAEVTHRYSVAAPAADRDGDGVGDAGDSCPAVPNADQADADGDRIGDACELLPPGNRPVAAGQSTVATLVSGEVFVLLPTVATTVMRTRLQQLGSGFVSLKGVASLPVGTVVDARKGSLAINSAANSRPVGDPRRRIQVATFAAGMFRIRQRRPPAVSSRRIPTDAVLLSAPGAERVCVGSTRTRPVKGVVRTLSASGKGTFRAVAGASIGIARNATWITTDRCDGTLTEVGRGRVSVRGRGSRRPVTVRAGRGYFVPGRLFAVSKGRPG
jgi:hypothetical protein